MTNILLLTSEYFKCECGPLENNMVHKIGKIFNTGYTLVSNSRCNRYISHPECSLDEIKTLIHNGEIDIIITLFSTFPSADHISNEPVFNILLSIPKNIVTIHVDYFERSWNNKGSSLRDEPFYHRSLFKYSDLYFKRELYPDLRELGCIAFPEPTFRETFDEQPIKKYDVFCSFPQKWTGLRQACIRVSHRLLEDGYNIIIKDDCTPDEYVDYVKGSYITLDAHGGGQVNHRFLEIIALRSVCCRQKYTIEYYKDYDSGMIIEYNNEYELYTKLKSYLQMKELLLEMEIRAHNHYLLYHTTKEIGKYLSNYIQKLGSTPS